MKANTVYLCPKRNAMIRNLNRELSWCRVNSKKYLELNDAINKYWIEEISKQVA